MIYPIQQNHGVWKNFQPTQILPHCKRLSSTFSTSSTPKSAWTIPNPELLTNKKISKKLSSVNNDELAEMSDTTRGNNLRVDQDFALNMGWALKENMKFGNKGARKHIKKKILQYLQSFFLASNLKATDRYSPEDMHADLEDLTRNSEISFEEVPTVKTIKG
ncbi:42571_t:CDS:2 [Gigaspora margarita]|uniref:42571_t:CDS:1 n=1 Tax=Gigaspora margarita TaxID=4874 RepID=A0ABN7VK67_GIGMA|nr:42571_t:CDS:2 [Gigaspora margarita]